MEGSSGGDRRYLHAIGGGVLRARWRLWSFLREVRFHLVGMTGKEKKGIVDELRAHLREKAVELGGGRITKESMAASTAAMGHPEEIAAGFRGDEAPQVELRTRALLTLNLAWGFSLIVISSAFIPGLRLISTEILCYLGILLGVLSSSLYLLQIARPGTIPLLRVYVLFPACGGAIVLLLMLLGSVTPTPGFILMNLPITMGHQYALILLALALNVASIGICHRDSLRYPFLFRGIGFVMDGYIRKMNKGLKPLDSVTKSSILGEMESHVEERSAGALELPRKERDRRLEDLMGDPSVTARTLVKDHERKASRRLRILLRVFLIIGVVSLGFGVLLAIRSSLDVMSSYEYLTSGILISTSVMITLATLLIFFVMKQMTFNTKTKDYLLTSTVLFVVVTLTLSFAIGSLVTGGLRAAHVPHNVHATEAVAVSDEGGYDVFWTEIGTPANNNQGDRFLHHSTLDEHGVRIRDRDLGESTLDYFPREFTRIEDTYYFGGSWLTMIDTDDGDLNTIELPFPQTDERPRLLDMEVERDDDNVGVMRVIRIGELGSLHYERVSSSGEIDGNWTHDFTHASPDYAEAAVVGDSIFLLWSEIAFGDDYHRSLLRYEFLSTDGLVVDRGTLHHSNMTRSSLIDTFNVTTVSIREILWHGSNVCALWSYEIVDNGEYDYSLMLSSVRDPGAEVENYTLQSVHRSLPEHGYIGKPRIFGFPYATVNSNPAALSYFFSVSNATDSGNDRSVTGVYVVRLDGSGNVSFHTRVHWPTMEHSFAFPVLAAAQNETYVFWIDLAEFIPRPAYRSIPVHMVRLSEAGILTETKMVISDPRISFMMWMMHDSGQGPFAAGDEKFDFVNVGGRQRFTLTEQLFGESTETPWNSQVLHARLDFQSGQWSFHGISEEYIVPDSVSDLILTAALPALGVGIGQWLFMYTRVWWSRRKGTA